MDSDVDDVGALAMLHAYERQGKANILGIIVTSDDLYSAACTDAINTYFKRKNILIGVSQKDSLKSFSKYTKRIASEFPHQLPSNAAAETSTSVYRRILAGQPDHSVVIITLGHLTSLSNLLASPADKISSLSGEELVARKVKSWSCMGGRFPSGKEANFYRPDPASTVTCLKAWKLPVTFAGWEVGEQIITGGEFFKANSDPLSPISRAYELYNQFKGRASWDQVAVMEAIEGAEPNFSIVKNGTCVISPDGSNTWSENTGNYRHRYLKIKSSPQAISKKIDQLMLNH